MVNCPVGKIVRWEIVLLGKLFGGKTAWWENGTVGNQTGGIMVRWENVHVGKWQSEKTAEWKNGLVGE